ncbi:MAG: SAM-dependent methyltransferase [Ginsengibacter sp.]
MQLAEIIINKIKKEGPISFRDYMEMALYYPSTGYYNSATNKISKEGDYYTSPVLSSFFGEMIGKQMEEMWILLGKIPFTIVEYGAGTGALCSGIIEYLKNNFELFENLTYVIIEKSESMRKAQEKRFNHKVKWFNSIEEAGPINGCILSNEVLDNFAVHKVMMKEELMEVFLDHEKDFIEILKPAGEKLKNYLLEQQIVLPKNYTTEINLQAIEWIKEIAENLNTGFVFTIDYGFEANELYSEKRNSGTLLCYKGHEINTDFYSNTGLQDITAHVNFSVLSHWGKKYGLDCIGFTTQANFLRSMGLMNYLRKLEKEDSDESKNSISQINKLILSMGNKFKLLVQKKEVSQKFLTGLQFANPCP